MNVGDRVLELGTAIKKLRKERGITQKKLGERIGVSEGTISKYESNDSIPPLETLCRIARLFNISMDTLCGMEHQGTLSTHGLSETQTETIKELICAYKSKNCQTIKHTTTEQYAVIGKIAAELTK